MKLKAKFKIGDIVAMKDDFHFNPAEDALSVGRIEAIHFCRGKSNSGQHRPVKISEMPLSGRVIYTVSGFSLMPDEKDLTLWKEVTNES